MRKGRQDITPACLEGRLESQPVAHGSQGRTIRLLRTSRTPLVLRARYSAWDFSAFDLAKPDKATVPLSESTLTEAASTVLSATNLAFTEVAMVCSAATVLSGLMVERNT